MELLSINHVHSNWLVVCSGSHDVDGGMVAIFALHLVVLGWKHWQPATVLCCMVVFSANYGVVGWMVLCSPNYVVGDCMLC
jgi:hypothetical protein